MKAITEERGKIRKEELLDKANTKIEKAQKKLDDGKAESEQKLQTQKDRSQTERRRFTGKGNTRKREVADGRCEGEDPGEAAGIG